MNGAHSTATPDLEDFAAAFALEALDPEERDVYGRHLTRCELCQRLVGDFQAVTDIFPDYLEEIDAAPGLKEGILSQARSDVGIDTLHSAEVSEAEHKGLRWPAWVAPMSLGFAAAIAIAALGLIAWTFNLQQDTERLRRENVVLRANIDELSQSSSNLTQLVSSVVSGASVLPIPGTGQAPGALGALVQSTRGLQSFLIANNLPALSQNQEFQVWQIAGGVPKSVTTFSAIDSGETVVPLGIGFSEEDLLGVSIEPIGGSDQPTGAIVLQGPAQ